MKYLLDTCVISELRHKSPNAKVLDWLSGQVPDDMFLSVITIGELRRGARAVSDKVKQRQISGKSWGQTPKMIVGICRSSRRLV